MFDGAGSSLASELALKTFKQYAEHSDNFNVRRALGILQNHLMEVLRGEVMTTATLLHFDIASFGAAVLNFAAAGDSPLMITRQSFSSVRRQTRARVWATGLLPTTS
jgi:hypothetical protein